MLVDSHCHLDFPEFADDLEATLARAHAAGVDVMVTISTRLDRFAAVRAVAASHPQVWCSVGIHPHEAAGDPAITTARLVELASHPRVVAVGETGLDYYYDHSPREVQRQVFRTHIRAAREAGVPLVVHTRDADEDTAAILREEHAQGAFTGLIHCFSGGQALAEAALDLGMYISCSGIITFNKAEEVRAVVRTVPLDRLLVETDAPFLAPVPHRGKRNEPAFTALTAARLAELKGVSREAIASATTANFLRLFTRVAP